MKYFQGVRGAAKRFVSVFLLCLTISSVSGAGERAVPATVKGMTIAESIRYNGRTLRYNLKESDGWIELGHDSPEGSSLTRFLWKNIKGVTVKKRYDGGHLRYAIRFALTTHGAEHRNYPQNGPGSTGNRHEPVDLKRSPHASLYINRAFFLKMRPFIASLVDAGIPVSMKADLWQQLRL